MNQLPENFSFSYLLAISGGILSSFLGMSVLLGWYTHNETLIQVSAAFVPMQYNTALGFLLSGLGLLLIIIGRQRAGFVCAIIVLLIGLLTLSEYILVIDFGIDQLLMEHYITTKTSHPGRMAPNTALSFSLTSLALILLSYIFNVHKSTTIVGIIGSLIFALSIVALAGYAVSVEAAYGWGKLTRMAVHTAIGFLLLGVAITSLAWSKSDLDSLHLPPWFHLLIGISVLTIMLSVWHVLNTQEIILIKKYGVIEEYKSHIDIILLIGILFAFALSIAAYLAQTNKKRTIELSKVNEYLSAEITERKQVETELKGNKHYLEKAQELGKLGSWEIDIKSNKILWTDETYRIFSLPQGTLINYETFINCVHPDDREYVNKEWEKALSGKPYDLEHRVIANDIVCWVREKAELSFDDDGQAILATGFVQDITEKKRYEEQIKQMALYDSLTGLANRHQLNLRFDESLAYAKRYKLNTGFLMIDLDNFKPINDLLGHHMGDETLKKVANTLSDTCRETDLVIRLGGDEFAVLVTTINDDSTLESLAQRIVSSLSAPLTVMDHNVEISVSIGVAKYPEDGESQDVLMRKADVALYAVKNSGRNGFKFYQSAMDAE